ncbi:hypothetical protein F4604DRAFT_1993420 [Suillus subluteus]|nr:hypothetical protein F4604DRAFT_1993420 [Suillus subluteus]
MFRSWGNLATLHSISILIFLKLLFSNTESLFSNTERISNNYGMMLDKGGVSNSDISDEQQVRYHTFYNGILDMIPGFHATLDEMSYDELKPYITTHHELTMIQRLRIPQTSNAQLVHELCPRKWLDKFDIDVDLGIQRLQDGTWPLLSTNWPSFLYAADAIYDSEDPNIGLFCGHAGIRTFQHLYLGPAAAGSEEHNDDDSKHGRSKSKATMYGLTKVTPQAWAWAMCAVWFSLSACNSYKVCIRSFNLEDFFFTILETLNDPEDPWAVETMAWINEQVFGKHAAKAMMAAADDTNSDLAKMRAKCAARKQVSAAERPSSPAPPLSPPRPPSQVTPSTSSPPRALTPLTELESFPPSPAKHPPAIPTAVLPKPVPVAHKKAKPVPRPKAKPAPKPRSNTRGSARLSAGAIQVEEPTDEAGDAGILDVNAPTPPKKKPAPRRGLNTVACCIPLGHLTPIMLYITLALTTVPALTIFHFSHHHFALIGPLLLLSDSVRLVCYLSGMSHPGAHLTQWRGCLQVMFSLGEVRQAGGILPCLGRSYRAAPLLLM